MESLRTTSVPLSQRGIADEHHHVHVVVGFSSCGSGAAGTGWRLADPPNRKRVVYTGHVAAALAGKGARPRIPLWFLVLASQAPDWLVVAGRLMGHEISHVERLTETSLSFVLVALPFALAYYIHGRDLKSSAVVWLVSASHPILDFFTGTGALLPGGQASGLGWYHHPVRDFALEGGLILVAALIYRRGLPARARQSAALVLMFSLLVLFQATIDVYMASSIRNGWLSEEINSGKLFH